MTNTNPNTSLALDKAARNLADAMMTNYRKLHPDNPKIVSTDKLMDTVTNHALAAAAAGMTPVLIPDTAPATELAIELSHTVLESMEQLPALLDTLLT